MNFYDKVDEVLQTVTHPCNDAIPAGYYRRVKWELYNPTGAYIFPGNGVEWDTELVPLSKHLYISNPMGLRSQGYLEPLPPDPGEGGTVEPIPGIWVTKLGIRFSNQQEIDTYVSSIGATLLPGNDWYGADLSKESLFKTPFEKGMYTVENRGGIMTVDGPLMDYRTCITINNDYNMGINYTTGEDYRRAYLKYYEDKPCTYVGLSLNLDVDLSIPGTPVPGPVSIGSLPPELPSSMMFGRAAKAVSCVPFTAEFPYNGLTEAIMKSWNTSRSSFKLYWDMLPGWPASGGTDWEKFFNSGYSHLSVAMEELGNSAIAMCQYAQQVAFAAFKESIQGVLNIVGGAWSLIKSFLPSITILGVTIDIEDLCTSGDGVQKLKTMWENLNLDDVIQGIYSAIGSAYNYSVERVKMYTRDLIDAITDLYDWCWSQLLQAGVALSKLCVDLAQIWSMPPIVPNPVWAVITAVKQIMMQIKPLDMIMSGNFPGFTASDVYQMVMVKVDEVVDVAYAEIEALKTQALELWEEIKHKKQEYQRQAIEFKQYLSGMAEEVTDELTAAKEAALKASKDALDLLTDKYKQLKDMISGQQASVSDILEMAMTEFRKLPIVAQMEELLSLAGATVDEIMVIYENAVTGAKSLYHEFTNGSRSMKDLCKSMYNQICTLSLSKVVQWINKLLGIFGLVIKFPSISICIPVLESPTRNI